MTNRTEIGDIAKNIKLLVLDVDGVLTDGQLYFNNEGLEAKAFNTLDGHGIKMLKRTGIEVGIITGRTSKLVPKRAEALGIQLVTQGREDKLDALKEMASQFGCDLKQIAFMGDDLPDLPAMLSAGLAFTLPTAHPELIKRSHWQSERGGGQGAVREACDLIMKAQNSYDDMIARYLV